MSDDSNDSSVDLNLNTKDKKYWMAEVSDSSDSTPSSSLSSEE